MGRGEKKKKTTLIGVWKKLIPTLTNDFEGLIFNGGSNCRCGRNSKGTRIGSGVFRCDSIAADS